jgi:hypothetical protein
MMQYLYPKLAFVSPLHHSRQSFASLWEARLVRWIAIRNGTSMAPSSLPRRKAQSFVGNLNRLWAIAPWDRFHKPQDVLLDDDKSKRSRDGFAWHVGQRWHVDTEVHHSFIHHSHVCKKA